MVYLNSKAIKNLRAAKITQIHLHNSSNAERLIFFKQHFNVSYMRIEKLISLNLDKSFL